MMIDDKDISEIIEEEAAALEAAESDPSGQEEEIENDEVQESDGAKEETEVAEEEQAEPETPAPVDPELSGIEAPEHWDESIRQAFNKADPETQSVWLNQQKEFQRGFNTVSQEAAELRRSAGKSADLNEAIAPAISAWQAQGMTPAQGMAQLVQLGMAYASNPTDTLIHLANMAGLDINELGAEAPYRTSDDIARDNRMQVLEQRLEQQDRRAAEGRQQVLMDEIAAFRDETGSDGNPTHPYFSEAMDNIQALFNKGFNGSLEQAYHQVIFTTPELSEKYRTAMSSAPALKVVPNDQNQIAAAEKAEAASSQRVKQSRPAPPNASDLDDLSTDDLIERIARGMDAKAG